MNYDECLHSTFLNSESWLMFGTSLAIAVALKKYSKTAFAIAANCFGSQIAIIWAYTYYEMRCVELIGL